MGALSEGSPTIVVEGTAGPQPEFVELSGRKEAPVKHISPLVPVLASTCIILHDF
jgi:hypothetical protein